MNETPTNVKNMLIYQTQKQAHYIKKRAYPINMNRNDNGQKDWTDGLMHKRADGQRNGGMNGRTDNPTHFIRSSMWKELIIGFSDSISSLENSPHKTENKSQVISSGNFSPISIFLFSRSVRS